MRWLIGLLWFLPSVAWADDFTTLKGHGGPIMGIDVAPSGQVATASFDNSVGLWQGRDPAWLDGHRAAVVAVNFDAAPLVLSGGDDFEVLLWTPGESTPQVVTKHLGKVSDIAISLDGERIASAGWDGFINLVTPGPLAEERASYPVDFKTTVLKGHRSNVTAVAFAPNGTLYSASSDGTLRVWTGTLPNLTSRVLVKHGFGINKIIVADNWIAYGAVDGGTRVVDPENGAQIADFTLDRRPILAMDHNEATQQIAVGDGHGYIMILDTKNWQITRDFRATRQGPVWALAFSPDGSTIYAGGLDDVAYAWPVALLSEFDPAIDGERSFLRDAASMPNGERQFMRKCSICHALEAGPSRKAGPTLHGVFGRRAGALKDYNYSSTLDGSDIIWSDDTIDALFDEGPDHYIPGSKMPMQVIAAQSDRDDLIAYLKQATSGE